MVNVTIQQALSSISLMTSPIIDLISRPESPKKHQQLKATTTDTTTTTTTTLPPPQAPQQSTTEAMMVKRIGELEHILADLIQVNKTMEERLDKHGARLYTLEQLNIPQQVSTVSEVVTDAVDWAMQAQLRNHFKDLPKADMKEILHQRMWESDSYKSHEDHMQLFEALEKSMNHLDMDEAMGPDEQAQLSDEEDIRSAYIPTTSDIATFMDWFCKRRGITELKPQDLEGPAYEIVKVFHLDMKAAYYPDAGVEQMVPDQFWIEEECKYDIAAMYGISHWWFQRQRFYIDRHMSEGDCSTVRIHMRILSVVRIEVFSMYGYDYMKKIVLRRADLNEHVIVERDLKYLYPSDFEDLNMLNLQGHLNHLPPKDKKILTTADKYGVQMMMRFNEIHKFSDGTLQQIVEALGYRVKEFKINRMNPEAFEDTENLSQLESFVGGRVREGDYRPMRRTD
nr:hypothetical protein [Tanacetum cinerariifolium]